VNNKKMVRKHPGGLDSNWENSGANKKESVGGKRFLLPIESQIIIKVKRAGERKEEEKSLPLGSAET